MKSKTRLSVDALVIREMSVGESDKLLTLLTKEFGVIKAFSSGAKNISSKKFSASTLLSYANFSLVKVNDTYKIYEATSICSFFSAGQDICILSLAQYFCELAITFVQTDIPANEYLRLMLNSLDQIVNKKRNFYLIKAITELRFAALSGYMPNIVACDVCAVYEDDIMYFDVQTGSLLCRECKKGSNFERAINKTLLDSMRYIVFSEFSKLYSFEIPEEDAKRLSKITEEFLTLCCERKFTTLNFFNSLIEYEP